MRSRWLAIGLGLLGAALVLAAASRGWVSETVPGLPGAAPKVRTGADLVPAVPALALASAAGAVVLGTAGRVIRFVAALLLVLAAAGIGVATLTGADGGAAGSAGSVAAAGSAAVRTTSGWPWLAVAGAVLVLLAGLLALARSHSWPRPTRRYERPAAGPEAASGGAAGPGGDDWASLSRGHDPT